MMFLKDSLKVQMGETAYEVEYNAGKRLHPEDYIDTKISELLEQNRRWETSSKKTNGSLQLSIKEWRLIDIMDKHVNCDNFWSHLSDVKFLRTILRVAAAIDSCQGICYIKKWRGVLFPTYAVILDRADKVTRVYVKIRRIHSHFDKRIYEVLDLSENRHIAITQRTCSREGLEELRLPEVVNSASTPFLVPPFFKIYRFKKFKGGAKLLALGSLFKGSVDGLRGKIRYMDHLKAVFAAAKGEQYLQMEGYTHRDIKPHNIFITMQNEFCLGDFGLTVRLHTYEVPGTEWFAAPETYHDKATSKMNAIWEIGATGLYLLGCDLTFDNFIEKKKKGGLNQEIIDKYLQDLEDRFKINNSKNESVDKFQKLFNLYARCHCLNPYERPLLNEIIYILQWLQDQESSQKKEDNNRKSDAERAAEG